MVSILRIMWRFKFSAGAFGLHVSDLAMESGSSRQRRERSPVPADADLLAWRLRDDIIAALEDRAFQRLAVLARRAARIQVTVASLESSGLATLLNDASIWFLASDSATAAFARQVVSKWRDIYKK